ncbi:hypothetical protein KFU94_44305 [Chloroflexi bacterium TSY]|nr:hypothetical protein [Chloroflexi bacterium TSY]
MAATAPGDYLAPYLDGLQKRGIDISDYPSQLTAIGYGEPTFAAFYPNSQSVFGLHDPDFGGVDPPDGLWYEVYGCYETLGDDPLADDPIHQLAGDIPAAVDANNFLTWFDKTQHLITRLEEFYGWSAPFAWSQDEVDLVNRLLADILQPRLGETTIDVHLPSEPKRDLHGRQALVDYLTDSKEGWLTPRQLKQAFDTKKVVQPSRTVSLEKLIQSCALQRPQRLICYGQVWRDSFVRSGVSAHSNQIFVGSTGTEAVAAYSASELALDRYPRTPDPSDDEHAYASYIQVQRNEKARLERFIEAIHLTPMLDKQRVDIGARLEEERHTKSFTAHPGSMLWLVTLASQIAAEDHAPSDNEEPPVELSLPPDLAHELNELNALQSAYDQAQHAVTALRQQIYCDWYRYMLLAYPSDDDALDYEAVRLAPDIDGLIAYIRGKDVRPLEEAVQHAGRVDELDDHSAATGSAPNQRWQCDWRLVVAGSVDSLARQLDRAIAKLCRDLNEHNLAQTHPNLENQWALARTVGPRFWSPNEPAILLAGLSASDRYGDDGRLSHDELLTCSFVSDVTFPPADLDVARSDNIATLAELETALTKLRAAVNPILSPYYRRGQFDPQHPFLLEWETELAQVRPDGYRRNPSLAYQPDEVRDHWRLTETDAELTGRGGEAADHERTLLFRGSNLLTDYAGQVMDGAVEAYLLNSLADYFTRYQIEPEQRKEHLRTYPAQARSWLVEDRSADDLKPAADALTTMGQTHKDTLFGILPKKRVATAIVQFLTHYHDPKNRPLTDETRRHLSPLLVVLLPPEPPKQTKPDDPKPEEPAAEPATPPAPEHVLPYLLGLSDKETETFVTEIKKCLTGESAERTLITAERLVVLLRYADALGYVADAVDTANFRENVLWRPLVLGLPDGGSIAAALLSMVNRATSAQLTATGLSDLAVAEIVRARQIQPFESLNQLAGLRHVDAAQMSHLLYHIDDEDRPWKREHFNGLDDQGHYWVDPRLTAFDVWQSLSHSSGLLTVTLDGFNDALLSKERSWQLPVADPLGFAEYQAFSELTIKPLVGRQTQAPLPDTPFSPIRGGHFNLVGLRLVDVFGQVQSIETNQVRTTEQMTSRSTLPISLPPRLVQPARLNLRWLAAEPASSLPQPNEQEWNAHPAPSPICGWALPNMLDARLMIYSQDGLALGSLDQLGHWRPTPGAASYALPEDIPNRHLRRMVLWLRDKAAEADGDTFIPEFVDALESAMEYIDPDGFEQHQSLSLLVGRPLALVRASISLELQEPYAVQQSLLAFNQSVGGRERSTQGFETVRFPVRIGEHHRFHDGVVGYWMEERAGSQAGRLSETMYAPQSDWISAEDHTDDIQIYRRKDGAFNLWLALDDAPQTISVLMDARASLHATSGILPTKELTIPVDQYLPALRAIQVTFLTAPVLSPRDTLQLGLPHLAGWRWSWIEQQDDRWSTMPSIPALDQADLRQAFGDDGPTLWRLLLATNLLTALPSDSSQAYYDAHQLEPSLDLLYGPGNTVTLKTERSDLKRFLEISVKAIESLSYEAHFGPQTLREGWLQLSPIRASSNGVFQEADFEAQLGAERGQKIWTELVSKKALTPFVPNGSEPQNGTASNSLHGLAVLDAAKLRTALPSIEINKRKLTKHEQQQTKEFFGVTQVFSTLGDE